jgi:hypothetical protein
MKVVDIAFNLIDVSDDDIELIYDRYVDKYECVCGAIIKKQNKQRHCKSKRHTIYMDKLKSKS